MKNLKDILHKVPVQTVRGKMDIDIVSLAFDSRKIDKGSLFVAQKGLTYDGHQFIKEAIKKGAIAVVYQDSITSKNQNITFIKVEDSSQSLAIVASNFYDNPSSKVSLVGITGTNGKTTVASLLFQLFKKIGYKVGLLSTVKILIDQTQYDTTHTTPDSITINRHLSKMVAEGIDYCFMEVSSHGIAQNRIKALTFVGGIFTNLSHDHLDYHKTFKDYSNVKKSFFDSLPKSAFALTNIDDKNGNYMLQNTRARKFSYSIKNISDYQARIIEKNFSGTLLNINRTEVWTKLIGKFNAYNLIAVYATASILQLETFRILTTISTLENVNGRFDYVTSDNSITAIVDYAHTPDALKKVIETINDIRTGKERLITIVGCGGNRDQGKRPIMANIASKLSSRVIFTSDNSRTENPQDIINEMVKGVKLEDQAKTKIIIDRKQAIEAAYHFAKNKDIILIAGKGHETFQEVNGARTHFNDLEEITKLMLND